MTGQTIDEGLDDGKNRIPSPDNVVAASYLILAMIAGVIGNGWIVVAYFKNKLRSHYNSLVLNLAFAESLMLMSFPAKIVALFLAQFDNEFPLSWLGCQIIGCLSFVSGIASIMTLFAMSVERYYATRNPRNARQIQVFSWLLSIWIFSIGWGILPLVGWSEYIPEPNQLTCSIDWQSEDPRVTSYLACSLVLVWLLPTTIMAFFYGRIAWLRRAKVGPSVDVATIEQTGEQVVDIKWHHTWASLAMLISYVACWTPYAAISLFSNTLGAFSISPASSLVAPIMAKTFAVLNPAIYFIFEHIDMFSDVPPVARAEAMTPISVLGSLDRYHQSHPRANSIARGRASERRRVSFAFSVATTASSSHLANSNSSRGIREQQYTTTTSYREGSPELN